MQDPILDIFDRMTDLYKTVIDRLKESNAQRESIIEILRLRVNEKDEEIKRLYTYINDKANAMHNTKKEPDYIIDAGIGTMEVFVENLQLRILIEQLDEYIKKHGVHAAINVLSPPK